MSGDSQSGVGSEPSTMAATASPTSPDATPGEQADSSGAEPATTQGDDTDPTGAEPEDAEPAGAPAPASSPYRPRPLAARLFLGAGRTVIALASIAVLVLSWYAWHNLRDLNNGITRTHVLDHAAVAQPAGPGVAPPTTAQNILLVGMDSRTDPQGNPLPPSELAALNAGPNSGEENTDTMILIHIPAGGQRAVAISFPRDSYVQLADGFGMNRLNSAFAYGHNAEVSKLQGGGLSSAEVQRQADDAGRRTLIDTIQNLTGYTFKITEYAEVNLVGFDNISQAVGGVRVCLKGPTYDDATHAHFPAGVQTLEGVQALNFVRERHGLPRGDLDRIVRQQVFMGALANKILSANTLANPTKLAQLIKAVQSSVVLSAGWNITTFAAQMAGLSSGNIQFTTIPTGDNFATSGGADVTRVDPSQISQFVANAINAADNGMPLQDTATDTPTATVNPTSPATSGHRSDSTPPATDTISPGTSTTPSNTSVITANGIPCVN